MMTKLEIIMGIYQRCSTDGNADSFWVFDNAEAIWLDLDFLVQLRWMGYHKLLASQGHRQKF